MLNEIILKITHQNIVFPITTLIVSIVAFLSSLTFIYSVYTKVHSIKVEKLFDTVLGATLLSVLAYAIIYLPSRLPAISFIVVFAVTAFVIYSRRRKHDRDGFFNMFSYLLFIYQAVILGDLIVGWIMHGWPFFLFIPVLILMAGSIAMINYQYKQECVITLSWMLWGVYLLLEYYFSKGKIHYLNLFAIFVILIGIISTIFVVMFYREDTLKFFRNKFKRSVKI